jgi:hypothetical protein
MTKPQLEAERIALIAEGRELELAHARLHLTPNDRAAHAAHLKRLKAHTARVRAYKDALHAFHQRPDR